MKVITIRCSAFYVCHIYLFMLIIKPALIKLDNPWGHDLMKPSVNVDAGVWFLVRSRARIIVGSTLFCCIF